MRPAETAEAASAAAEGGSVVFFDDFASHADDVVVLFVSGRLISTLVTVCCWDPFRGLDVEDEEISELGDVVREEGDVEPARPDLEEEVVTAAAAAAAATVVAGRDLRTGIRKTVH